MIKLKLKKWFLMGWIVSSLLGVLFHFIFDWSKHSYLIGMIAPVNESIWEHLKLLFWPILLYSLVEYFLINKEYTNYLYGKVVGLLLGMAFIIVAFFTYTGIVGDNFIFIDILIYLLSVVVAQFVGYKWTISTKDYGMNRQFSILVILGLVLLFILFTFRPPHIPLFEDPSTGQYGINK
jgi:Family of unknown function (DUF6512)